MGSHVLHLVLAAMVLIALQFLPSSASAHSGHDHDGHAHGRHVAHHEMALVQSVDPAASRTETASSGPSAGMASSHGEPCALNCLACAGGGTACCGAAMILPSAPGLPRRASLPVAVAARDVPTPTGIGPEALHEPPKPHA